MNAAGCATCGRSGLRLKGGVCSRCAAFGRIERCATCGAERPVCTRTAEGAPVCGLCRRRQLAAERTACLHGDAAAVVAGWLGGVDAAVVRRAVEAAAINLRQAEWLAAALVEGPAVLQGSTTAPPVIDRLVAALSAVGVAGVAAPCCVRCGRREWLSQRIEGHRACQPCAQASRVEVCVRCGKSKPVTVRDATGAAVCSPCHRGDRSRWTPCARCGNVRPTGRRLEDGSGWCPSCIRRVAVCSICGNERFCAGIGEGRPRCDACSARRAACSWCGRSARVSVVWASGPVCATCRYRGLEAKAVCDGCGELRRPDPRHPSGRCADCVGLPAFNVCSACGLEDRIYRAGRCVRCELLAAVDAVATGAATDLSMLRATLASTDRPRAVLRWMETPFVAGALARIAGGEIPLTHAGIDELGANLAVTRLRGVLVQCGLLPERSEVMAGLEAWIDLQLAGITDAEDRRAVEAFARWRVLRRARDRARRIEPATTKSARRMVSRAIEFLAFVRAHGRTLSDCTQADVDLWLAGPPARRHVHDFVVWARRHHLCGPIDVPVRPQAWPTREMTGAELRAVVARLLADDGLRVAERVAGLFVACYGQTPARLVRLTIDHVSIGAETVSVRFGRDDIVLPPAVAAVVVELIGSRRGRAATEPQATSRWLFPGALPGRPLASETLRKRLHRAGVPSLKVRSAALLDLAADVPASILADLVGLDPGTATRWTRAAGGDWAGYVATRVAPSSLIRSGTTGAPNREPNANIFNTIR